MDVAEKEATPFETFLVRPRLSLAEFLFRILLGLLSAFFWLACVGLIRALFRDWPPSSAVLFLTLVMPMLALIFTWNLLNRFVSYRIDEQGIHKGGWLPPNWSLRFGNADYAKLVAALNQIEMPLGPSSN